MYGRGRGAGWGLCGSGFANGGAGRAQAMVAGNGVPVLNQQRGRGGAAQLCGMGAARVKGAALGQIYKRGCLPGNGIEPLLARGVDTGHGGEQAVGVVVSGRLKKFIHMAGFSHAPCIHHQHTVGMACHHAQIVRNQNRGGVAALAQFGEQIHHLRLHGNIQRRSGLVGNEHTRVVGQRHGYNHTLAHAAREMVRIIFGALLRVGNAHFVQQIYGLLLRLAVADALVRCNGFGNLLANLVDGVKRRKRVLKHHGNFAPAQLAALALGHLQQLAPVKNNAATHLRRRWQQPHYRQRRNRFARTTFAHNGQTLACAHLPSYAIYRTHQTLRCWKRHA